MSNNSDTWDSDGSLREGQRMRIGRRIPIVLPLELPWPASKFWTFVKIL